jgi:hypothetical protein
MDAIFGEIGIVPNLAMSRAASTARSYLCLSVIICVSTYRALQWLGQLPGWLPTRKKMEHG